MINGSAYLDLETSNKRKETEVSTSLLPGLPLGKISRASRIG